MERLTKIWDGFEVVEGAKGRLDDAKACVVLHCKSTTRRPQLIPREA